MKKIIFLILLLLPVVGGAAHITDRLLAGMYATPDTSKEPIKLLPSGTPLDIISEKNGLIKIKLVDGKQGWVEKRFLSEDKPAKSRLLVLQSKYRQMQREFDDAKRKLIKLEKAKPANEISDKTALAKKYALQKVELETLNKQLQASLSNKAKGADVEPLLAEAQAEILLLKKQRETPQNSLIDTASGFSAWWFLIVAAILLPAGFAGGLWLQDARQLKRHGGFRI